MSNILVYVNNTVENLVTKALADVANELQGELMWESAYFRTDSSSNKSYVVLHLDYTADFEENEEFIFAIMHDSYMVHQAIRQVTLELDGAFILPYLVKPGNNVLFEAVTTY